MITAFIKAQAIETAESVIVAESLNYLKAQFVFITSDWNGLEKTAYFTQDETTHPIKLDENNIAFPLHLSAGEWAVSVVGREYKNGELAERITTDTATITVKPFKTGTETPFPEPTPTEIEALKAEMGNLPDLSTKDKTSLVNAINEVYRRGGSGGGSGGGLTDEQLADLEANTEARHEHSNKDALDSFGLNALGTRPTFNRVDTPYTYILATTDDVRSSSLDVENKLNGNIQNIRQLPSVSESDNGKALVVADGEWTAVAVLDEIPEIPTKTSQLENDSNFVTAEYVTNAINGSLDEVEAMIDESGVLDE